MKPTPMLLTCLIGLAVPLIGLAQATLQFTAASYSVAENAVTATLTVQRTGETNAEAGVDYATIDGTATHGLKYTAVSGTLTFGAGKTHQDIAVPILNGGLVDGTKTFRVVLSNPTGGAILGMRTNATVSITDNDGGVQLQFAAYSVAEDAGGVLMGVVRGDDGTFPVTMDVATVNLTAISGLDYVGFTNSLAFGPRERLKLISVPILNDGVKEANKTFRVTLSNPTGATLGSQKTTTVTIMDNDPGFQFEFANYSVAEDAGTVRLSVRRGTDDTDSPVAVDFATSDLSATNGLDYSGTAKTLSFAPGEKVKLVTVPILNDAVKEPIRNFRVTLSNPTDGAVLGSPRTAANVAIVDNDPGLGFEFTSHVVEENAVAVTLAISRGNDLALGPLTVDFATSNLSATAGQDYQAVSGTLTFVENETIKILTIPILRNGAVTNETAFKVSLSNPTGGATLGIAATTVNILNAPEAGIIQTVAPAFNTALSIQREGEVNLLTWSGSGQLQRADRPAGPWQTLTTATSPFTVQSPLATTFYRVTRPRPAALYIPSGYHDQTPAPLVIALHGYTGTGVGNESSKRFRPLAEARGFLYCYPDGRMDLGGNRGWNATDACCGDYSTSIDDAGCLRALIEEIANQFSVDRKRIHLFGHSNGGFMAYRMACESADVIAGIASLAGTTYLDPSQCAPSEPVNILHIHGTADDTILYRGNAATGAPNAYPGALESVQFWAGYNGATGPVTDPTVSMDLSLDVAGLDTVITRYTNAPPGGAVELWTINGGGHSSAFYRGSSASEFSPRVIDWLLAHPKP